MMMNQQNTANNQMSGLIAGLGQLGTSLSEGAVNTAKRNLSNAQSQLARTPMQIEENIYDLSLL